MAHAFRNPSVHVAVLLGLTAALMATELMAERKVAGGVGLALDDSWIHAAVARHFVEGQGFGVNPGHPLGVSTAPAWTLLVAFFYAFFRNPVPAALAASLLCTFGASALAYLVARKMTGSCAAGSAAGVFLLLSDLAVWGLGSGMEIPLALLAVTLVFVAFSLSTPLSAGRRFGLPLALALAAASRPELFVLAPVAVWESWREAARAGGREAAWRTVAVQVLVLAAALAPYFAFHFSTSGHLLPTTFYAKASHRGVGLAGALRTGRLADVWESFVENPVEQFQKLAQYLAQENAVLLLLVPVGLLALNQRFIPLSFIALPLAMGLMTPVTAFANAAGRYYAIFAPFTAVLGALGLAELWKRRLKLLVAAAVVVLAFDVLGDRLPWNIRRVAQDVDTTERLYVSMGRWIAGHIEPDALIAVNDIGAVAYFGGHRILDVMGLASPETWPVISRRRGEKVDVEALKSFLASKGAAYLVTSPHYYPDLVEDEKTFVPVAEFSEQFHSERRWSPQVVYRCAWQTP